MSSQLATVAVAIPAYNEADGIADRVFVPDFGDRIALVARQSSGER